MSFHKNVCIYLFSQAIVYMQTYIHARTHIFAAILLYTHTSTLVFRRLREFLRKRETSGNCDAFQNIYIYSHEAQQGQLKLINKCKSSILFTFSIIFAKLLRYLPLTDYACSHLRLLSFLTITQSNVSTPLILL